MKLRKSIERIEKRIGVEGNWEDLWERYRGIYLNDGASLSDRAVRPYPPCTWQDRNYEYLDWVLDIQNGGKEMELVKKRIVDPEIFEKFYSGTSLENAMEYRKASNKLSVIYGELLRELCDASGQNYQISWLSERMQSYFKEEVGPVNYQMLDHAVSQYQQKIDRKKEKVGYGPRVFYLFQEAGYRGDAIFWENNKMQMAEQNERASSNR
jgi:hypothetical protein